MVIPVKFHFLLGRWEVFSLVKIGYILLLCKFSPFYLHFFLFWKSYFHALPHFVLGGWKLCNNISTIQTGKPNIKFGFLYSTVPLKWHWNCWYRTLFFTTPDNYFTVAVLAVLVNVVQTYSVKSSLKTRTSSCKFVQLKSGLILFFGKREKTKKYTKEQLHLLVPIMLLLK